VEETQNLNTFVNSDGSTATLPPSLYLLRRIIEAIRNGDPDFFRRIIVMHRNARSKAHPFRPMDSLAQLLTIFCAKCGGGSENPRPAGYTFQNFEKFAGPVLRGDFPDYRHIRAVAKLIGKPFAKDPPGPVPGSSA
jgi:hypothetical protein